MCKPESVFENETYTIVWDIVMITVHPIPVKRLDLVLLNKKKKKVNSAVCNLGTVTENWNGDLINWELEKDLRPFRPQDCKIQREYLIQVRIVKLTSVKKKKNQL